MELKDWLGIASFGVNFALLAYGYGRLTNKVENLEKDCKGVETTLRGDMDRVFKHTGQLFDRVTELDKESAGQKQINISVQDLLDRMDKKLDRILEGRSGLNG